MNTSGSPAPVAQIDTATSTTHWTFTDHLGTPQLQTNAAGAVDWRAEYEPYGTVFAYRSGATRHQPLRFPGQEYDEAVSGREYNIFRWYASAWGRYMQRDPIGLTGGPNVYSYVGDSPIRYNDRLGLISQSDLDKMSCCELREAIKDAWKEIRRLWTNEMDPDKTLAESPFQQWLNYVGHLEKWWNFQRRLGQLLEEFDGRPCDGGVPQLTRDWANKNYPDFNWKRFRDLNSRNWDELWDTTWDYLRSGGGGPIGIPGGATFPTFAGVQ